MASIEDLNRKILLDGTPRLLYCPEIGSETKSRITEVREFLDENREYSFILYFNHISYNDPAVAAHIAERIDPHHTRHLLAPASFSHTDPDDPKSKGFSFLVEMAKKCGVEIIRVIQSYQVNNPKYGYTEEQARSTYMDLMRRLKQLRSEGVPTGFMISPEGHRSETGEMILAQPGVVAAGRMLAPVIYVPVGVSYLGKYDRDTINIGRRVRLSVGEVTTQTDPKVYPSVEELMYKLALTLPEEMRGVWK